MACSVTLRAGAGLPARAQTITAEHTATAAALAKQALLRRPAGEAAPAGSGPPVQKPRCGALLRLEMCTRMQVAAYSAHALGCRCELKEPLQYGARICGNTQHLQVSAGSWQKDSCLKRREG